MKTYQVTVFHENKLHTETQVARSVKQLKTRLHRYWLDKGIEARIVRIEKID